MDFRGKKKTPISGTKEKQLPGFRAESELPEHSLRPAQQVSEDELAAAFGSDVSEKSLSSTDDPTDLSLERDTSPSIPTPDTRPFAKPMKPKSKKKHIIILIILLSIVAAAAAGWYVSQRLADKQAKEGTVTTEKDVDTKKSESPKTVAAPLTGREVSPDVATRPVTAIMIENSPDARPQGGLIEADMVWEAVAEGGITRFVALFQEGQPDYVGPIRSARPYYVQIARTFDAPFVHAGGSPDGLAKITELGVKDMSAFEENGTYTRIKTRAAPHNLYSSLILLNNREKAVGFGESKFTQWKRKNDTPQTPTASKIDFAVSGPLYNPTFTYDAATNSYLRSHQTKPHTDEKTSKQLNPKVVIGLITSKGQDGQYSTYRLSGSGDIRVFQDGIMSEGTWTKESDTSQFVFKDKNGLEFTFNKGQVWVTLLGSVSNITATP